MSTQINYLDRDFQSNKDSLIDFAKTYFPNTFNDFGEADPAMMFIEMSAYVGDILNFYIDKSVQENFLEYAQNKDSLLALAYFSGYRPKTTSTSIVDLDVYQLVPSKLISGSATPDFDYAVSIDKQARIKSTSKTDIIFITQDLVDFSFSSSYDPTTVSVYEINQFSNLPDYFLLKKKVKAIAGNIKTQEFNVGSPEKFISFNLSDDNIIEILNVTDSDGNKWYEVPYLAQDTILEEVKNNYLNDPKMSQYEQDTPYLLRLKKIQRRFTTRLQSDNSLNIEFGSGVSNKPDEYIIPNTENVGMGLVDGISKINQSYDPSNFLYTGEYGLSPANTTLIVEYSVGGGVSSNVPANDLTQKYQLTVNSVNLASNNLNQTMLTFVKNSVEFNNEKASSGGGDGDTMDDIRLKSLASYSAQMRSVSDSDHVIRAYSLPPKYGSIAKAFISKDNINNKFGNINDMKKDPFLLNLYILSYDSTKKLTYGSVALKHNLKTYLNQFKILSDAINIKDAYYINIGINFDIIVIPSFNNREVLSNCLQKVKEFFNIDKWSINQPIIISDLRKEIGYVPGVQSVTKIEIVNKSGEDKGYSRFGYDIQSATKMDIIYPSKDAAIFEVRYPDQDIKGKVVTI